MAPSELPSEPPSERSAELPDAFLGERDQARARVGSTIQRKWKLDSLLGTGGMAAVYAATHRNGSRAALKIMHRELASEPAVRERFLREGYVANKIDHPGRVAILDDDVTDSGEPFLVMELLDGETVQQLWKRKGRRLSVPEALFIASEVLDTLTAFHAQGIIHRDLKPANVFLTRDGAVKILDFGVARMRNAGGDQTRAGTALGTPSFMAPEQAMGLTDTIDGRADVFSVGATLYALLSGQRLHQGRTDNEAFILAATSPAPSLARMAPEVPIDVIALVDRALAWDARNRFPGAAAMREEVLGLLRKHTPDGASPLTPRTREPVATPSTGLQSLRSPAISATGMSQTPTPSSVAPTMEAPEPVAALGDPAVIRMAELWKRMERVMSSFQLFGRDHPDTNAKLHGATQALLDALRAGGEVEGARRPGSMEPVDVTVAPYALEHRGQPVWEPTGPFEPVPYQLYSSGVRRIVFEPGITDDELFSFCQALLLDPARDLSAEDDLASALWERQFQRIRVHAVAMLAEGDALEREAFYSEADEIEAATARAAEDRANRVEALAMAVSTDDAAGRAAAAAAAALQLDPAARAALGAHLSSPIDRWNERFADVFAQAFVRAAATPGAAACVEAWARAVERLVLAQKPDAALALVEAVRDAVASYVNDLRGPSAMGPEASGALIDDVVRQGLAPQTLLRLLRELGPRGRGGMLVARGSIPPPPGGAAAQPQAGLSATELLSIAGRLVRLIDALDDRCLDVALGALGAVAHDGVRRALFALVQRAIVGNEDKVVQAVPGLDLEHGRQLLRLLAAAGPAVARRALAALSAVPSAALRCEAVAVLSSTPDEMRDELMRLAEAQDADLRAAALRTLAEHKIRAAGPLLVKRVQDPAFQDLRIAERREILSALFALHPSRAESLAGEICKKHGIMPDEALDETRAVCAELLGDHGSSEEALAAVIDATKRRWWNGPGLRQVAARAADAIAQRLGKRISPTGDVE